MARGNGIESKGKTKGKNLGNDGPKVGMQGGGTGSPKGVSSAEQKAVGRGLAKRNNQVGK